MSEEIYLMKGNEAIACRKVKEKYFDWMCKERDLYFFLGTTKQFHNVAPNPFIITKAVLNRMLISVRKLLHSMYRMSKSIQGTSAVDN